MRRRSLPFLALLTAGAAACADGPAGGRGTWQATTDTVGDTVVVRTESGSVWGADARLVEELRIGVVEGEEAYMFGLIGTVAADPAGRIYVVDEQVPAVRVYDAQGTHIFNAGARGGGPGEYERPRGIAFLPGGDWAVYDDSRMKRLNVYGPDGSPASTRTFTNTFSAYGQPFPLHPRADGAVAVPTTIRREDGSRAAFLWVAPDGLVTDTLLQPTDPTDTPPFTVDVGGGGRASFSVPLAPRLTWTLSPAGHPVTGTGARYAVTIHRPEQPLRMERVTEPVTLPDSERRERQDAYEAGVRGSAPDFRWTGRFPTTKPFFRHLFTGADGRIWVRVNLPSERREIPPPASAEPGTPPRVTWYEPQRWDVFEPDGRYLGAVDMPDDFTLHHARGEHVWGVTLDDLGVNYVVRMRIQPGAADGG
ncbi:MAG: 6-bladed beta-propeller [Gemmatimonadota bacterium]